MKRQPDTTEFEKIKKYLTELGCTKLCEGLALETTFINGATMYEVNETAEGVKLRYLEDDLTDENGNPYLFETPYLKMLGDFKPGKRLIALYTGNSHFILPVNGEIFTLTGAFNEDMVNSFDKSRAVLLPDPIVLRLPRTKARPIEKKDTDYIIKTLKKYKRYKAAVAVGTICMSPVWLIILGLIMIFSTDALFNEVGIDEVFIIPYMSIFLMLFIVAVIFTVKFFNNIYIRNALKMK